MRRVFLSLRNFIGNSEEKHNNDQKNRDKIIILTKKVKIKFIL